MDNQTLFAACERNCGKYVSAVLKIKALKIKALGGLQISQAADNDSFSNRIEMALQSTSNPILGQIMDSFITILFRMWI